MGDEVDPQHLNELANTLAGWKVYTQYEINGWCEIWFRNRMQPTGGEHKQLNAMLDMAVERFIALAEEQQDEFKSQLVSFRNLYMFLSQIIPYQDSDLEKLYTYSRFLLNKLPRTSSEKKVTVDDDVELKYYRLEKISEGSINLRDGAAEYLKGPADVGTGQADEEVRLSTLVAALNERFGTEFTPADQLFFEQVRETVVANELLRQAALVNSMENFAPIFNKQLETLLIERMEGNEDTFSRMMNDDAFRNVAAGYLMKAVYRHIAAAGRKSM